MNREKLGRIKEEVNACCDDEKIKINLREFVLGSLVDVIDALLEEPKPVATEIMDERTRMKKLILEMLEIV